MKQFLRWGSVSITVSVLLLFVVGYFWHEPPAELYYLIVALNYGPLWLWLIPAAVAVILAWRVSLLSRLATVTLFVGTVAVQDVQSNLFFKQPSQDTTLSVMTFNRGGGVSPAAIKGLIDQHKPDIIAIQETRQSDMDAIFAGSWNTHCTAHLCLATQYPLRLKQNYGRRFFNDWGDFAAAYDVEVGTGGVTVVNTHLETPRDALGRRPFLDFDSDDVAQYQYVKHTELGVIQALLMSKKPVIVLGDLNTKTSEAEYQYHLGEFKNAVSLASAGINYTKFTRWHGVRIDHVIVNESVLVKNAHVLGAMAGDHRPVMADVVIEEVTH
ncbi:endonuclease/exonuclease/phosphatase family protein [Alteromonas sp. CYL-A6]|uniref:endonuclease/exonuclease/phosphatase family protein n=1 Tax=Alteromonas nitratireducens TaxID=3390813 RepID=UPI0034BA2CCD